MFSSFIARLRSIALVRMFTAFTRVSLAIGFFAPGLKKVLGMPFTVLPTTHPVGYFFDAFFQAQEFYLAVGLAQVIAALLLLFPRTATLGAILYFPIILNITIVTWSIGFVGTNWVTLFMTLGCLYLLLWDYERLKNILPIKERRSLAASKMWIQTAALFSVLGMLGYALVAMINLANAWTTFGFLGFAIAAVLGAIFGLFLSLHVRLMPSE
ncbi:MAG: hypothetical protein O3B41_05485 [Bacteroidetes bacterium]|nr:hypothetical protein [Bacteroidota bacterium]